MAESSASGMTPAELPTSESPVPPPSAREKVIYVMGAGHSGSTILGVTLGNCEGFFYTGELEWWLRNSGMPNFGGSERTRFWAKVRERMGDTDDLFGTDVRDAVERSSSVLRLGKLRVRRRLRRRYQRVTEDLLRAVAGVAQATYVVDSSHFPLRARELQRLSGIELYLLFLVRDPGSVVESDIQTVNRHARAERTSRVIAKNLDLWLTNVLAVPVFLRQPRERRLFVRHEQFIADPEGVLRQILDNVDSPSAIPDLTALKTGWPIRGNRLLRSEVVALQSKARSPVRGSRITNLLQLPWTPVFARLRPAVLSAPAAPAARERG